MEPSMKEALEFVTLVKQRFHDQSRRFKQFIDIVGDFVFHGIDTDDLISVVKTLFNGHDDLMRRFYYFLPREYVIKVPDDDNGGGGVSPPAAIKTGTSPGPDDDSTSRKRVAVDLINKVQKRFKKEDPKYICFFDALFNYNEDPKNAENIRGEITVLFKDHPDLFIEFTTCIVDPSEIASARARREENQSKNQCFREIHRSPYEEALFDCEDEKYELDLLSSWLKSTIVNMEKLLKLIDGKEKALKGKISKNPIRVELEEHLTVHNLRCIERLYQDHGQDVLEFLRENPSFAASIVLTRLKQKREELEGFRGKVNKNWRRVCGKIREKRVLAASSFFKRKSLSPTSCMTEVEDIGDERQKQSGRANCLCCRK